MGNNNGHADENTGHFEPFMEERVEHKVTLDGFWIDVHEVTNSQFEQFVNETGYVTTAERIPEKGWLPEGFPEDKLIAGSAVFRPPEKIDRQSDIYQWWQYLPGADWRHPQDPGSTIKDKMNHPVVHVTFDDAQAYAKWSGKSLPTEAQWEYAARGGLEGQSYTWGNHYRHQETWMANTWQGDFPTKDSGEDGFAGTAPVGCYLPNGYGLYDMAGNVWEIVLDKYRPGHSMKDMHNLMGSDGNIDLRVPSGASHVIKGGSYLCNPGFCMRYRPAARQHHDYTMGTSHVGFRTVINGEK